MKIKPKNICVDKPAIADALYCSPTANFNLKNDIYCFIKYFDINL